MKDKFNKFSDSVLSPKERAGVKLKICGMKFQKNIADISNYNPDFMGFVFYEKSKRFFENETLEISESIKKVGVFVNPKISEVEQKVKQFNLNIVQLHGTEPSVFCTELKSKLSDITIWKAFSLDDKFDFESMKSYVEVDKFLFDTKGENYGGNGFKFNWEILRKYNSDKGFVLSGGISITDVPEIQKLKSTVPQLEIVDVNSKLESEPGFKDPELVNKFIRKIKEIS